MAVLSICMRLVLLYICIRLLDPIFYVANTYLCYSANDLLENGKAIVDTVVIQADALYYYLPIYSILKYMIDAFTNRVDSCTLVWQCLPLRGAEVEEPLLRLWYF